MNICILMGRLTAAPELRSTQSGTSVLQFTLAVDRDYQKQGEERQADFIYCVAWRQTAEFISRYFGKGAMIAVEGSIQTRNYEDKQGNKRTATELIVNKAHFTGEKKEGGSQGGYQQPAQQDSYQQYANDPNVLSEDGIPF